MLYESLLRSLLFRLPAERAHEWSLHALTTALRSERARHLARSYFKSTDTAAFGEIKRFGFTFDNPVGLAAGFDKTGEASSALAALGFGFIEAGTATYHPQPGNPPPRLFRLPADEALINRLGFNNPGANRVAANLARQRPACVLGVNIGKSRVAAIDEATADYLLSFDAVFDVADYIAINVSSPNTPGLRDLQHGDHLHKLLYVLQERNRELAAQRRTTPRPLLVKVAPDLTHEQLDEIVRAALNAKLAGIIATNTTTARPASLRATRIQVERIGAGGLSGRPLQSRSTEVIRELYRLTGAQLPIVGVGGIFSADDAWEKITAGASLVQIWTGFIYGGAGIVRRINNGLAARLAQENFKTLDEAVGSQAD